MHPKDRVRWFPVESATQWVEVVDRVVQLGQVDGERRVIDQRLLRP